MPSAPRLKESLEIQGNVLAAFPVAHQAFVLIGWSHPGAAKQWLAALLPQVSATADLTRDAPARSPDEGVCCSVGLTHDGLVALAPAWRDDLASFVAFRQGPAARAEKLGDSGASAPDRWFFGDQTHPPVHAVVTVASDALPAVTAALARLEALAARHDVSLVYVQRAGRLPPPMAGHEHFGFVDDLGQPIVEGFDSPPGPSEAGRARHDVLPVGEFVLGYARAGRHATEAAPLPCARWMLDGAFQVLKRLNQDVAGWRAQLARLGRCPVSRIPRSDALLAAKFVGRWPDGAPLALAPDRDDGTPADQAFDFEDDPYGWKTPRFAHIRKMYPRLASVGDRSWRRIIRRAVPFGAIYAPALGPAHGARADRGLMMNAFMASIDQQFEFLLRGWANDPDFPEADDGNDALIGRPSSVVLSAAGGVKETLHLECFVRTTGAIYAFVPSHSTLRQLAG